MDPFFLPMLMRRPDSPRYSFDEGPPLPFPGQGFRVIVRVPRPPYTNNRFRPPVVKPTNPNLMQSTKTYLSDYSTTQGEYWALLGHQAYEENDFAQAITHYNKAIEMTDGSVSTMFRARGLAFRKSGNLEPALRDAVQAIQVDNTNFKAQLLCGQLLAEKGKSANNIQDIETAITRLSKAKILCVGQKKEYYLDMLSKYVYRAKKLLWYKTQEIQKIERIQAIANYKASLQQREDLTNEKREKELERFIEVIGDPNEQFQFDIPSYLTCKISQELMENPVVTDAGQVYEKEMISKHIATTASPFQPALDPITRQQISGRLLPVNNIKQATEVFLLNNPWAFEYSPGENYKDIEF